MRVRAGSPSPTGPAPPRASILSPCDPSVSALGGPGAVGSEPGTASCGPPVLRPFPRGWGRKALVTRQGSRVRPCTCAPPCGAALAREQPRFPPWLLPGCVQSAWTGQALSPGPYASTKDPGAILRLLMARGSPGSEDLKTV